MEKNLDRVMDELIGKPGVYGCMFSDHQGLCLGAKGKAPMESSGILSAIAEQAAKLEPTSSAPIVRIENDSHSCTIHRVGTVTGAVFKNINS